MVVQHDEKLRKLLEPYVFGSPTTASSYMIVSHDHDSPRSGYEEVVSEEGWQQPIASDDIQTAGHSKLVIESLKSRIQQLVNPRNIGPVHLAIFNCLLV